MKMKKMMFVVLCSFLFFFRAGNSVSADEEENTRILEYYGTGYTYDHSYDVSRYTYSQRSIKNGENYENQFERAGLMYLSNDGIGNVEKPLNYTRFTIKKTMEAVLDFETESMGWPVGRANEEVLYSIIEMVYDGIVNSYQNEIGTALFRFTSNYDRELNGTYILVYAALGRRVLFIGEKLLNFDR
jgi:hypothetical protein